MSGSRDRRDRDRRPSERRDAQPDEEQQRRPGDPDLQESDSLTALKAILGKVASLLTSLQLNQDESISLVEQLYGSVLDTDLKLAGETDDKRKASVLAHIQNTTITRVDGKLVVEYPKIEAAKPVEAPKPAATPKPVDAPKPAAEPVVAAPAVAPTAAPAAAPAVAPAAAPEAAPAVAPVEAPVAPEAAPQVAAEPPAPAPAPETAVQETLDLES